MKGTVHLWPVNFMHCLHERFIVTHAAVPHQQFMTKSREWQLKLKAASFHFASGRGSLVGGKVQHWEEVGARSFEWMQMRSFWLGHSE